MGIRPRRSGEVISIPVSDARDQFNELVTDVESKGKPAAEAIGDIAATAGSANAGTVEVAEELAALESLITAFTSRTEVSGAGWTARKVGGVVTVSIVNANAAFTLPEGYRPVSLSYFPLAFGKDTLNARFTINASGTVQFLNHTFPVYGTATFVAA